MPLAINKISVPKCILQFVPREKYFALFELPGCWAEHEIGTGIFKWTIQYMAEQMTNQMQSRLSLLGLGEVEKQQNPQDMSSESHPCSPPQRRRGKYMVTHKTCGNKWMATSKKWEYELHGM